MQIYHVTIVNRAYQLCEPIYQMFGSICKSIKQFSAKKFSDR